MGPVKIARRALGEISPGLSTRGPVIEWAPPSDMIPTGFTRAVGAVEKPSTTLHGVHEGGLAGPDPEAEDHQRGSEDGKENRTPVRKDRSRCPDHQGHRETDRPNENGREPVSA